MSGFMTYPEPDFYRNSGGRQMKKFLLKITNGDVMVANIIDILS